MNEKLKMNLRVTTRKEREEQLQVPNHVKVNPKDVDKATIGLTHDEDRQEAIVSIEEGIYLPPETRNEELSRHLRYGAGNHKWDSGQPVKRIKVRR